jgi:hypothetical protein
MVISKAFINSWTGITKGCENVQKEFEFGKQQEKEKGMIEGSVFVNKLLEAIVDMRHAMNMNKNKNI